MNNPMCDGSWCASETGQVRVLPLGPSANDGNLILCRSCLEHEMRYRRERNRLLAEDCKYDICSWDKLKVYGQKETEAAL